MLFVNHKDIMCDVYHIESWGCWASYSKHKRFHLSSLPSKQEEYRPFFPCLMNGDCSLPSTSCGNVLLRKKVRRKEESVLPGFIQNHI